MKLGHPNQFGTTDSGELYSILAITSPTHMLPLPPTNGKHFLIVPFGFPPWTTS
jgi:hypothetical protein